MRQLHPLSSMLLSWFLLFFNSDFRGMSEKTICSRSIFKLNDLMVFRKLPNSYAYLFLCERLGFIG